MLRYTVSVRVGVSGDSFVGERTRKFPSILPSHCSLAHIASFTYCLHLSVKKCTGVINGLVL